MIVSPRANRTREWLSQRRLMSSLERWLRMKLHSEFSSLAAHLEAAWLSGRWGAMDELLAHHNARVRSWLQSSWIVSHTALANRVRKSIPKPKSVLRVGGTRDEGIEAEQRATSAARRWVQVNGAARVNAIGETTRAIIHHAVDEGVRGGEDEGSIGKRIRSSVSDMSVSRSETIARTETTAAANAGSLEAAGESGLPLVKEWIATRDERTRESHKDADGQQQALEDAFELEGPDGEPEYLMYPGDPDADPSLTINCRCAMVYSVAPNRRNE